jgi:hypothetical protein
VRRREEGGGQRVRGKGGWVGMEGESRRVGEGEAVEERGACKDTRH